MRTGVFPIETNQSTGMGPAFYSMVVTTGLEQDPLFCRRTRQSRKALHSLNPDLAIRPLEHAVADRPGFSLP